MVEIWGLSDNHITWFDPAGFSADEQNCGLQPSADRAVFSWGGHATRLAKKIRASFFMESNEEQTLDCWQSVFLSRFQ